MNEKKTLLDALRNLKVQTGSLAGGRKDGEG